MIKILFISHDATRTGAPFVLLHLIRWLKTNTNYKISLLLLDGGDLKEEFEALVTTYLWNPCQPDLRLHKRVLSKLTKKPQFISFPQELKGKKFDLIYANTVASTYALPQVQQHLGSPILLHVHENEYTIKNFYPNSLKKEFTSLVSRFIAVSESTRRVLQNNYNVPESKIDLIYEFVPFISQEPYKTTREIKDYLDITNEIVIGGAGLTSWRKGIDLFVQVASEVVKNTPNTFKFVWVGSVLPEFEIKLAYEMNRLGIPENAIVFTGKVPDPQNYLQIFDLFFLSSREDPFPLVCLEAAALSKPIMCFEHSGGMPEVINSKNGFILPYGDVDSAVRVIKSLTHNPALLSILGQRAYDDFSKFDVHNQAQKIYDIIETNF